MTGSVYLDPGGPTFRGHRVTYDPPRRCVVLTAWDTSRIKTGPRNVAVQYDDGTRAVIPFSRRLRLPREAFSG